MPYKFFKVFVYTLRRDLLLTWHCPSSVCRKKELRRTSYTDELDSHSALINKSQLPAAAEFEEKLFSITYQTQWICAVLHDCIRECQTVHLCRLTLAFKKRRVSRCKLYSRLTILVFPQHLSLQDLSVKALTAHLWRQ